MEKNKIVKMSLTLKKGLLDRLNTAWETGYLQNRNALVVQFIIEGLERLDAKNAPEVKKPLGRPKKEKDTLYITLDNLGSNTFCVDPEHYLDKIEKFKKMLTSTSVTLEQKVDAKFFIENFGTIETALTKENISENFPELLRKLEKKWGAGGLNPFTGANEKWSI